jgi:hypothetical protein
VFEATHQLDISGIQKIGCSDVYFVEIDKVEKHVLLHLKKLLLEKKDSLIYFFINDSHSLMLFQLASFLNVKTIVTKKSDIPKLISNIKKDISSKKVIQLEHSIVETMVREHCFMIFNSNQLKFASQKIYDEFDCKGLDDVESKVCSQFNLDEFLSHAVSSQESVEFLSNSNRYNIKSSDSAVNEDMFIYLEKCSADDSKDRLDVDFIKNRIYFIEVLKEKILEKSISDSLLGVITIKVENIAKLRDEWSEYEIEEAIHDLLVEVDIAMESHTVLAQYDNRFYLALFEELDFESIKSKAMSLQNHIASYSKKLKIKPVIGLYGFDINGLELNDILEIISDLSREVITRPEIKNQKLYKIINVSEDMDDTDAIDILLQAVYTNRSPTRLVNIYKGLCINTSSTVLRRTSKEIDVTYKELQGIVMNFEKEVVLQSPSFSKDIVADVIYMDFKKKFARLNNFRFAQGSANARKYSRVTCSQRTPITIVYDKGTLSGTVLDISMNSIAIKTRIYKNIDSLKLSKISLNFTLPTYHGEVGYIKLSLPAKVIFTSCDEEFCKVIVSLYENQDSESILMEYVYNRQKEIILELNKQTSFLK